MADKNLHDIKIDELDSPKKTPLKSILTLLALLFIILVISVVITRLILGTDGGKEAEEGITPSGLATEVQTDKNESLATNLSNGTKATLAAAAATTAAAAVTTTATSAAKKVPVISNILERNNSSRTKTPLRTHEPVKPVKEVKKLVTETPKTYKTPKHTSSSKHTTVTKKHTSSTKKHTSTPKKEYVDKVIVKKHTTKKYVSKKSSTTHGANYLGGKQKKLTRSYYIQVGSYKNTRTILSKVKKQNFNYSLQKVDGNSNITRVFVGPFFSQAQAEKNLSKVKKHILSGAYVKKVVP